MKSINKYISLLAIAILAISTFGSASAAAPDVNIIVDKETHFIFNVGQKEFESHGFIDDSTIAVLEKVFSDNGLSLSEYLTINETSGVKYVDAVVKGGIALKTDKVISTTPNAETGKIDKHIERISLIIWN
ncbi:MAG: conserved hypothetical protein [Methanobrevibacter sp. CfCl-M3]